MISFLIIWLIGIGVLWLIGTVIYIYSVSVLNDPEYPYSVKSAKKDQKTAFIIFRWSIVWFLFPLYLCIISWRK